MRRVGFEPTVSLHPQRFSSAPSGTEWVAHFIRIIERPAAREADAGPEGRVSTVITLPHVGSLLTTDKLDKLTRSMAAKLRPLSLAQREVVIRRILEADDWARRHSGRGWTRSTTLAATIRRDGVM
jgi:hypothetical protein